MKIALLTTDNREHDKKYSHPEPMFGTAPEALLQGFAMLPEVEVHVICCTRQPIRSPEKLAGNIWYHSLLVPKIGWMATGYQGCIRAVRKKLKEIQPDIVHGQGTERDCAITAVLSGFPNVLTLHGNIRLVAKVNRAKPFSYLWLNAYLERFTLPLTGGVVCITRYTQDAVKDLVRKTWVLPNATDARFFDVTPTPPETPEILVIGYACERKNQNAFIRALDELATQHTFRLTFLGQAPQDSPYAAEFLELVKARPWCNWSGFASRQELSERLAKATAVALPSIEDNCPMAVLEGSAAGVAIIAANVGGVPDLIVDGENGLLCDPYRAESMAAAVRRILENPAETARLAAAARKVAIERYHPKHIASEHVRIYREFLGKQPAS